MTGPAPLVRAARPGDADELGQVHVRVWRETYPGLMPAHHLAGLSAEASAARFAGRLAAPAAGSVTLVAVLAGRLVGVVSAGPSRDDPPDPAHEVYAINLLAAQHGTGLGARLLGEAVAATAGTGPVSLWVARGNARASAFYAKHGFAPDGSTKQHDGTGIAEDRWVRR